MKEEKLYITILAGGLGKRMNSTIPKVLHEVDKKPMLVRIINEVLLLNPFKIILIVGEFKNIIEATLKKYINIDYIEFVLQKIPLGTGNAVLYSLEYLPENGINLIIKQHC